MLPTLQKEEGFQFDCLFLCVCYAIAPTYLLTDFEVFFKYKDYFTFKGDEEGVEAFEEVESGLLDFTHFPLSTYINKTLQIDLTNTAKTDKRTFHVGFLLQNLVKIEIICFIISITYPYLIFISIMFI